MRKKVKNIYIYIFIIFYLVFNPTIDKKNKISFGEFCENLLKDYDYYGTRFNRIPIKIEREIKANLFNLQKSKQRKIENEKKIHLFIPNKICRGISFQDGEWHKGKIIQNFNNKKFCVLFEGEKDQGNFFGENRTENKCIFLFLFNFLIF